MYTIRIWVIDKGKCTRIIRDIEDITQAVGHIDRAYQDFDEVLEVHIYRR